MSDLPSKVRSIVTMKINNRKEYAEAETNFIRWLRKYNPQKATRVQKAERLVQLGYLRRLAATLKLPSVINWLQDFVEESDSKLIIFGIHKSVLGPLKEKFKKSCVFIDGQVRGASRQHAIDSFNKNPKARFLFGNIQAAGVGWSCTSTSEIGFIEFPWTPGDMMQAEDRVRGIGRGVQGRQSTYYNLVAEGTIEEKLVQLLAEKQLILDQTMDGEAGASGFNLLDLLTQAMVKEKKK